MPPGYGNTVPAGYAALRPATFGSYVLLRSNLASHACSLNNITSKKSPDGSVAIQFGGCDGKIPNCLPIMNGWNYTVRLYRPRAAILNGTWKLPQAQPVN